MTTINNTNDSKQKRARDRLHMRSAASHSVSMATASKASRYNYSKKGPDVKSHAAILLGKGGNLLGNVAVFDSEGLDVTPLPLGGTTGGSKGKSMNHTHSSDVNGSNVTKENVSEFLNQLESQSASASIGGSSAKSNASFGGGDTSSKISSSEASEDDDASRVDEQVDQEERLGSPIWKGKPISMSMLKSHHSIVDVDLSKSVHINIKESDTIVLFDQLSLVVSKESEVEYLALKDSNEKYEALKVLKLNNDNYVDRISQTIEMSRKNKDVQVSAVSTANADASVNNWILFDANQNETSEHTSGSPANISTTTDTNGLRRDISMKLLASGGASTASINQSISSKPDVSTFSASQLSNQASFRDIKDAVVPNAATNSSTSNETGQQSSSLEALEPKHLKRSLFLMERAIMNNVYDKKYLVYTNQEDAAQVEDEYWQEFDLIQSRDLEVNDEDEEEKPQVIVEEQDSSIALTVPAIGFLWSFRCEIARGRQVNSITWNTKSDDIMAVAYGESKSSSTAPIGLVLCWNVKNPEWPERIYYCNSPATCLDFSKHNPVLLAVGFQDGHISVFDIRSDSESESVLDNMGVSGKHHDPIWEIKWVEQEQNIGDEQSQKGEYLVSVSTDGRVSKWILHKGMEHSDLISLKRVTKAEGGGDESTPASSSPTYVGKSSNSLLSRQTGGLCFDFNPKDPSTYLVGTEDGHVHKCSSAYNEQYLASYFGHSGPIYRVKWNPFSSKAFLTCSTDWTVRLWDGEQEEDVFRFQSGKTVVMDLAWSPHQSTLFASVSMDGRLEIWDLTMSVIDPVAVHTVIDRSLTCVRFGTRSSTLFTGDDGGAVNVYTLRQPNRTFSAARFDEGREGAAEEWEAEVIKISEVIGTKLHPIDGCGVEGVPSSVDESVAAHV